MLCHLFREMITRNEKVKNEKRNDLTLKSGNDPSGTLRITKWSNKQICTAVWKGLVPTRCTLSLNM